MSKIKKTHKVILFFILIFLVGLYSFALYISNTIDKKKENIDESEIYDSRQFDREATQIH